MLPVRHIREVLKSELLSLWQRKSALSAVHVCVRQPVTFKGKDNVIHALFTWNEQMCKQVFLNENLSAFFTLSSFLSTAVNGMHPSEWRNQLTDRG